MTDKAQRALGFSVLSHVLEDSLSCSAVRLLFEEKEENEEGEVIGDDDVEEDDMNASDGEDREEDGRGKDRDEFNRRFDCCWRREACSIPRAKIVS